MFLILILCFCKVFLFLNFVYMLYFFCHIDSPEFFFSLELSFVPRKLILFSTPLILYCRAL